MSINYIWPHFMHFHETTIFFFFFFDTQPSVYWTLPTKKKKKNPKVQEIKVIFIKENTNCEPKKKKELENENKEIILSFD